MFDDVSVMSNGVDIFCPDVGDTVKDAVGAPHEAVAEMACVVELLPLALVAVKVTGHVPLVA